MQKNNNNFRISLLTCLSIMRRNLLIYCLFIAILVSVAESLYVRGAQSSYVLQLPFRTVKFIDKYIFFTTNNARYFGYINAQKKGAINVIYELDYNQRLIDELSTSNKLIIGNKNKTLLYFDPQNRTLEVDNRLVNESFKQLKAFKQINNKVYVITQKSVLFYRETPNKKLEFVKELLSREMLNPGVTEFYHNLYYFPTRKFPDRVIALTTAVLEKNEDTETERLLSCFKWFEGETQEVDGKCTIEKRIDIQDFRVTGRWAYLRMPDETYVYDDTLTMKTKWQQIPTQYIAGYAVTSDQMTYLYKTNELVYYRLVENYKNDDVKMTANGENILISKKGKTFARLTRPLQAEVIGAWMEETDELNHRLFLQFDKRDLHCYEIGIKEGSIEIGYLFRLTPNEFGFSGSVSSDGEFELIDGVLPHKIVDLAQKWAKENVQESQGL